MSQVKLISMERQETSGRFSNEIMSPDNMSHLSNVEAEMGLLGAIMVDNHLVAEISAQLHPKHFSEDIHRRIFEQIIVMVDDGKRANPVTLKPFFIDDNAMAALGGPHYLALLTENPAMVGAMDFARQIVELAKVRQLYIGLAGALNFIIEQSYDLSFVATARAVESLLFAVESQEIRDSKNTATVGETMDEAILAAETALKSGVQHGLCMPEMPEWRKVLMGGIYPGNLCIIAGRPGMGKTALALNAARSFSMNHSSDPTHIPVAGVYFNLEMTSKEFGDRQLCDISHYHGHPLNGHRLRNPEMLRDDDILAMTRAAAFARDMPLIIHSQRGITIEQIVLASRRYQRRFERAGHRLGYVVVDYIQLVNVDDRKGFGGRHDLVVGHISKTLKELAGQLNCAVLGLSQLSRNVEARDDKRPMMSDLRESGAIEQDADAIIFPYREIYYLKQKKPADLSKISVWESQSDQLKNVCDLIVAKARHGATGTETVQFFAGSQAFRGKNWQGASPRSMFDAGE